jgi:hypothetical protein
MPKRLGLCHHRTKLSRHSLPMRLCQPGTATQCLRRSHLFLPLPRLIQRCSYTSLTFPFSSLIPCRARKLQGDSKTGRYKSERPTLRIPASGDSPPNEVSPAATITPMDSPSLSTDAHTRLDRRATPGLKALLFNVPKDPPACSTLRTTRASTLNLRPGSPTTLPFTGLSDSISSSILSSPWLTSSNNNTATAFPVLEELHSLSGMNWDDTDLNTLDYHGLDKARHRPPSAAPISEFNNQAQAVIPGNLSNPPSLHATTVSRPYRRMSSLDSPFLVTSNSEDKEDKYNRDEYSPRVTKDPKKTTYQSPNSAIRRPRSISTRTLGSPQITHHATVPVGQPGYELSSLFNSINTTQLSQSSILKTDKSSSLRTGALSSVRSPVTEVSGSRTPSYPLTPSQPGHGHTLSPKAENPTQIQTPTRSLWIGNLDSSFTSERLIHVFAPYGAIENLTLLPEEVRYGHKQNVRTTDFS